MVEWSPTPNLDKSTCYNRFERLQKVVDPSLDYQFNRAKEIESASALAALKVLEYTPLLRNKLRCIMSSK